jgi:quercetin dioxygenase-like cupin family protein
MQFEIADFASLLVQAGNGPVWTQASTDLNVNLVRFDRGDGVPSHVNDQLDVLIVAVVGEGLVAIDGESHPIAAGQACIIPKGCTRSIQSSGGQFAYLTCHQSRGLLWPH